MTTLPTAFAMDAPSDPFLILLLAALVLALAALALFNNRRHERTQRDHLRALGEREQRLRLALWASDERYWQYHLPTHALEQILVSPDASSDLSVQIILNKDPHIHPDDLPLLQQRLRDYLSGHALFFLSEHRMLGNDGQWEWVRACGRSVEFSSSGRVVLIAGTVRNINAQMELQSQQQIAAEVMRCMNEAVAVMDEHFHFIRVNSSFSKVSGYSEAEAVGQDASILNGEQHEPEFYQQARQQILAQESWSGEMWQRRKDGTDFLCAMQCNAIQEPGSGRKLYVLVTNDITERRRIEKELRYLANYDPLTNLPNRTLLSERLSRAIVQARRQNTRLALLFMDLDNFKDINDSLGHAMGDRVLRSVARRMQEVIGIEHTLARVSGDEFVAILEHIEHADEADACAQRILTAFDAPLRIDERHSFTISPSIGISLFPDHAQVPTDLMKHADTAMYRAKAAGKHALMHYQVSMDDDIRRRAGLIAALRNAIEHHQLQLVFQPQLSLASGHISAVEALLRWTSPEYGVVSPAEFIPLAEESGLIISIGQWVLEEACRTLVAWHHAGIAPTLIMSVNVSALQLQRDGLSNALSNTLTHHGLPASALELELTESVVMADADLSSKRLQAFRAMGVSIAVDDFGTGYSSLAYLHRLPLTTLKIDKVFIDGLGATIENEDTTITPTIIAMAHALGLRVVAEGVETQEQLEFLRTHHCDIVQGYWFSKPLSADACLRFLLDHTSLAA